MTILKKLFSSSPPTANRWLLVGLGNPGSQYAGTRHNIGFQVIQRLAEITAIQPKTEKKFNAIVGNGLLAKHPVLLVQPLTYMNLSGESVGKLLKYYHIPPSQLLVIYDDTALPFGKLRIRIEGSAGGHNGMKSIIQHLGGDTQFPRLRVGIGAPPNQRPLHDHVLSTFSPVEQQALKGILDATTEAVELLLSQGVETAMNRFNGQSLLSEGL